MVNANEIREHAEVIGADGQHVGTVDHVEGNRIKLTKNDSGPEGHSGHHHYIDLSQVSSIDGGKVRLSVNAQDAIAAEQEPQQSQTGYGSGQEASGGQDASSGRENAAFFSSSPNNNPGEGLAGGGGQIGSTAIDSNGGEFAQERKTGV
ncbi:hypothetical protein FHS92_001657 [Sphingobium subterraneum]|uniref:DUF2171 domain-containing protein n=1 Tax=Sphingobium subterraneum TaxID=627688 RepID=A0A841J5Y0_9SPHN|nr:hypothetical protein [Sphingobium subterraneum]